MTWYDEMVRPRSGFRLTRSVPRPPEDTVVVKLRTGGPAARRIAAAAGLGRGGRTAETEGAAQPIISALVQNGHVRDVEAIFPATVPFNLAATHTAGRRAALSLAAATVPGPKAKVSRARGLVSLTVERGTNARELAEHLRASGEVEYAYVPPVKRLLARRGPDPLASRQWAHGAVRVFDARARAGFKDAAGITVAVVDSGVDDQHPDLAASIVEYKNFLDTLEAPRDFIGHGTHCGGIIAAGLNNRIGVAGLCTAKLLMLKALPSKVPWNAKCYYQALGYVIGRAQVLSLSLGGDVDPGERDVIADVLDDGVSVVAAMGNEFEEGNPVEYPAAYDGVIAVGASDEADRRAPFSNTGKHIALVAPGVNILSTVPTYPSLDARQLNYDSWDGTSMATPHVAAAAALLKAKNKAMTPRQVRDRLMRTADRVPGQSKRNDRYGAGRLNISRALA